MSDKQKMILGFVLLGLCLCCMATWMSMPFTDFDIKTKTLVITIFMILGKVTFFSASYFLGKPFIQKYKDRLMFWKKGTPQ